MLALKSLATAVGAMLLLGGNIGKLATADDPQTNMSPAKTAEEGKATATIVCRVVDDNGVPVHELSDCC